MAAKSVESIKPKDINFPDIVVDLTFHPEKDVIGAGTIEGDVFLHSYSTSTENSELMKLKYHKKSCRVLRFSEDGETLYSASKDKSIGVVDLNTGAVKNTITDAHSCPIYSLLVTGENYIATGDDDGYLKLWDLRQKTAVMEARENEEFISDIVMDNKRKTLVVTCGDGTLTAFNLRRRKMELQSELFESEFLSAAIVKRGQKVVVGCGLGELNIFNWGEWGNISDRFPGKEMSIDCMVPLTDDIVIAGSCDGMIRAINIQPTRYLGVIGDHDGGLPIENISMSRDKNFLASCSHDQKIKFWNIQNVEKERINKKEKAKKGNKNKFLKSAQKDNFFSGLMEDEPGTSKGAIEDSDDDDDDGSDDDDLSDDDVNDEDGGVGNVNDDEQWETDDDDDEIDSELDGENELEGGIALDDVEGGSDDGDDDDVNENGDLDDEDDDESDDNDGGTVDGDKDKT